MPVPPILALAVLGMALVLALAASGCGRGGHGAPQQGGAPRRGGTLVTAWTAEPPGVNDLIGPQTAVMGELMVQLQLRLVEEQSDYTEHPATMLPLLARSFEWSPDHKALTFHLRDNAVWSDGVPVTADDVRWTWQAQTSPEVAWQFAFMKADIADVEVVDPKTARFRFKRVYAKQLLDANEGAILPRHAWGQLPFSRWRQSGDWFRQHLVGDGPFVLESWKHQQEIVLRRNERFFDPSRPYLDRMVMRIIPDQASLITQLDSGDIDYTPQIAPGDVPHVTANPHLTVLPYWFRTWVSVAWNNQHAPFSDPEVRRALTMGIDRRAIVDTLWGKFARLCDSPILTTVWAHNRSLVPFPYDPAAARRLLAARGFKPGPDGVLQRDGKPLAFDLLTNSGNQQRVDATVMVQAQLARIGVRAQPRQEEFNALTRQTEAGNYDACLTGSGMDTSLDLWAYFATSAIGESNFTRYSNPEVDRLIARSMSVPDITLARQDLDRIQLLVQHDQPCTFLWESQRLSAFDRRLHGVQPSLLYSMMRLRDWWLEAPPQH